MTHFPWPLDETCSKYTVTFGSNIPVCLISMTNTVAGIVLGLPDLDPWIRVTDLDPLVQTADPAAAPAPDLLSSSKNLDSFLPVPTVLWLLCDFLSLKDDVNVPSKSNKVISKKIIFSCHFEGHWRKWQNPAPGSESGSLPKCHGSTTLVTNTHDFHADPNPNPAF